MNTNFNNEREALAYRDNKRQEGHAASIITYGKDKFRIRVRDCMTKEDQQQFQHILSDHAYRITHDIEGLTRMKQILSNPNWSDCTEYDDILFIAKEMQKEHFFKFPQDVINFFDSPDKSETEIKAWVDDGLKQYDEDWNNKEGQHEQG